MTEQDIRDAAKLLAIQVKGLAAFARELAVDAEEESFALNWLGDQLDRAAVYMEA